MYYQGKLYSIVFNNKYFLWGITLTISSSYDASEFCDLAEKLGRHTNID